MIKRFYAKGYKSLNPVDVRLEPLSVLFGPNAAGKSNFLDAIQLLSRLVNVRTLKEAFDPPYRGRPLESFTFGKEGLDGNLKMEYLQFTFEVDVSLSEQTIKKVQSLISDLRKGVGDIAGAKPLMVNENQTAYSREPAQSAATNSIGQIKEKYLRYKLTVEILPKTGILRVKEENLRALKHDQTPRKGRNAFIETTGKHISLRMEGQAHPTYHDIGLDHTIVSLPLYPPHYPHVVAFKEELSSWFCYYFEPRERMRSPNPVKEVTHIGLMGEELAAFLNTLSHTNEKNFQNIKRAIHVLIPRISTIGIEVNKLGEAELTVKDNNIPISSRLLSEGTLRILGMLAIGAASVSPTVVAFEEPENGVHPRRISLIAVFLETQTQEGTQYIVTTHSPQLVDLLPPDALYVVKRNEERTEIEPFKDLWGPLSKPHAVAKGLTDKSEMDAPISERIMRGDFDE